jgi:outer membrane protein assembly factor BamB
MIDTKQASSKPVIKMPRPFAELLVLTLTMAISARAQTNWPSFRGANAQGIANEAVTVSEWNLQNSENILWKTAIPGLGHSSPIIWGDKLFI